MVVKVTLQLLPWHASLDLRLVRESFRFKIHSTNSFKTFYGTPDTVRAHWMGLNSLVVGRGGLKRLNNEMVRKLVIA